MIKRILLSTQPNGDEWLRLSLSFLFSSVPLDSLASDQERNIYELVTRHFIASCSQVLISFLRLLYSLIHIGCKRKSNHSQYHDSLSQRWRVSSHWSDGSGEELDRCLFQMGEVDWKQSCIFSDWRHLHSPKIGDDGRQVFPSRPFWFEITGTTAPPPLLSESDLIAEVCHHLPLSLWNSPRWIKLGSGLMQPSHSISLPFKSLFLASLHWLINSGEKLCLQKRRTTICSYRSRFESCWSSLPISFQALDLLKDTMIWDINWTNHS